jgi:hypothetical protein
MHRPKKPRGRQRSDKRETKRRGSNTPQREQKTKALGGLSTASTGKKETWNPNSDDVGHEGPEVIVIALKDLKVSNWTYRAVVERR